MCTQCKKHVSFYTNDILKKLKRWYEFKKMTLLKDNGQAI